MKNSNDKFFIEPSIPVNENVQIPVEAKEVTLQLQAALKMEESEHQYQELILSALSAIAILKGENYIITIANDPIVKIWGKGKDVIGKPFFNLLPEWVEQGYKEVFYGVYTTGVPFNALETAVTLLQDGKLETKYYNFLFQAVRNVKGEIDGIGLIATDVTLQALSNKKLKASEEQFQLLVEQAPVAICVLRGENYIIETINEGMVEMWGKKLIDVLKKPAFEVLPELLEQGFKDLLDNVYNSGERFVIQEAPINLQRNGKLENAFIKFIYEPLREADGTISGIMALAHEITEQVVARLQIEESEHRYFEMIDSSPSLIAILHGKEMILTFANDSILQQLGKGKDIIGKPYLQSNPELEEQGIGQLLRDVYITGIPHQTLEAPVIMVRNGKRELSYYHYLIQPRRKKNGEIEGLAIIASEVTSQGEINKKIKASEEQFRLLVLQAPVAICIFRSSRFNIEIANDEMLRFWDRTEEEVIGKPVFEAMPELIGQGFEELLQKVITTGERFSTTEVSVDLMRSGKIEKVFINLVYEALYEDDRTISGVIAVANVITEIVAARKRMEVQNLLFQDMLMTAPGIVCTLSGPDHVYELVNPQYQSLFGKRKLQGLPIKEALPELVGQGFYELLDNVYNTGEVYLGIDVPIVLGRDDTSVLETRYFNLSYQPMYDENKNIFSILVFGYEVTEQVIAKNKNLESQQLRAKVLEEKVQQRTLELSKANEDLQKMNGELESFTYVTSHDLQEPLRKIRTFAGRILEKDFEVLSDTGKDYFKRMTDAADRMQTLIKDLLLYSQTSIAERKLENSDLDKIVEEVKEDLMENILEKSAIIEAGHFGQAAINPFQFRQIMNNLIANAIKFSKTGVRPHIKIESKIRKGMDLQNKNLSPQKTYCHISVSDNGIGFNPEYKDKIFEVFQRLHAKEVYAGTGIGLAIVKKIVEDHDGIITATGILGEGATFDIYLPVK